MTLSTADRTNTLTTMLGYRRGASSVSERQFIDRFLLPLGMEEDAFGNYYKRIGDDPVLWSCHTDSVHSKDGMQSIVVKDGIAGLPKKSKSNCLGADDAAGCFILREMILAEKPGLYVFHRAEEIGGRGSMHIVNKERHLVRDIKCAIAFDRRGFRDVITHQGSRTCSDAFATSLADQIGMGYEPSSWGLFTDTANYIDLIGECTNVSVGYENEHRKSETLDIDHTMKVLNATLNMDTSKLVFERRAGEVDVEDLMDGGHPYGGSYGGQYEKYFDDEPSSIYSGNGTMSLRALCLKYPDEVASILESYGITADEVMDEIGRSYGTVRRSIGLSRL